MRTKGQFVLLGIVDQETRHYRPLLDWEIAVHWHLSSQKINNVLFQLLSFVSVQEVRVVFYLESPVLTAWSSQLTMFMAGATVWHTAPNGTIFISGVRIRGGLVKMPHQALCSHPCCTKAVASLKWMRRPHFFFYTMLSSVWLQPQGCMLHPSSLVMCAKRYLQGLRRLWPVTLAAAPQWDSLSREAFQPINWIPLNVLSLLRQLLAMTSAERLSDLLPCLHVYFWLWFKLT